MKRIGQSQRINLERGPGDAEIQVLQRRTLSVIGFRDLKAQRAERERPTLEQFRIAGILLGPPVYERQEPLELLFRSWHGEALRL